MQCNRKDVDHGWIAESGQRGTVLLGLHIRWESRLAFGAHRRGAGRPFLSPEPELTVLPQASGPDA